MLNPLKNVLTVEMARSLIAKIKGALATKVSMGDVVSSWQSTPDDAHVPTEKLVKDSLDNLPPGTAVKGDAESEYRTGNVNLTPANIGSYSKTESDNLLNAKENAVNKKQSVDPTSTTDFLSAKAVADFVNSSVATNTATFLGNFSLADLGLTYPATEVQIASALNSHTWPTGYPTNNDYVYVEIQNPQSTIDDKVQRYKYRDGLASWGYEYTLNNSSFTAEEKAAIDSGITSQDVTNLRADHTTLGTHVADTSNPHNVTAAQVGAEPAFSVLPVSKGGTGKTTGKSATNNLFSDINNVNTDPDDTARIVFKYGSPSDSNGIFFARAITNLWNYIKGKISSVLGLSENGYTGNAATATSAATASNYASGGGIDTALQGKSSTSHTHSVKINGNTKTIAATGGTAVDLGTYLTQHQDISGKLDKTGDASNTTSTFTKASGDTSSMSSGTKLSAIFTAISSFFASLKALAFKDNVSDSDISGTISDSHIASVAWSKVSSKPTKLSDFTDDITQQTYVASGTGSDKPASGAAVAQAVAKLTDGDAGVGYLAYGNAGISDAAVGSYGVLASVDMALRTYFNASFLLAYSKGDGSETSIAIVELSIKKASTTSVRPKIYLLNEVVKNKVDLVVTYDSTNNICYIYCQNKVKEWAGVRLVPLYAGGYGDDGNTYKAITFYHGRFSATKLGTDVTTIVYNTKDASWISSGTFQAAQIPTSLPAVTAGYANQVNVSEPLTGNAYLAVVSTNTVGNKVIYTAKNISAWQDDNNGAIMIIGLNGGEKSVARSGHLRIGNGAYVGYLKVDNLTASRQIQMPDAAGTLALQDGSYSSMSVGSAQTLPRGFAGFTDTTTGYKKIAELDVPSSNNDVIAVFDVYETEAGMNSNSRRCTLTLCIRNNSGTYSYSAYMTVERTLVHTTLSIRYDTSTGKILLFAHKSDSTYCGLYIILTGSGGWRGDNFNDKVTLFNNPNTESVSGYPEVSITTIRRVSAPTNGIGSSTKPVYADSTGELKPCSAELPSDYGTSGQYLKSMGANAAPVWDDTSNLSVGSASQVSATGTQKAVAVSVDGISHTNGSKSTVINGGQVATDTLSAETAVNSDGFWAKTYVLVYGGNTPGAPTGNYVLISPNGIRCNDAASFTGNLIGNASTASGVKDYNDASKTIEIGYAGQSLTSANYLAAYAVVDGHYYIKDISPSNVTVGRATADGSGNNIVNTYQQKIVYGMSTRSFDNVTVASLKNKSIGDRGSGAPGIAWPSFMANVNYIIEVDCTLSFNVPAGGCAIAVYLKHGSSYNDGTVIDTSVITQYAYASTPVNVSVHFSKGTSFSGSSDNRLFLGIFNTSQTAITFSVTNIRIKAIPNYVGMDGL